MFFQDPNLDAVARGLILSGLGLLWVVGLSRLVGLRSFSKMTAFDFVATIASGSLLANAGAAGDWEAFLQPLAGITSLFALQVILAWGRRRSRRFQNLIDNRPRLLMRDGKMIEDALDGTRVARSDVIAKLREANAHSPDQVAAVILEATGDISVLHKGQPDKRLLENVC